MKLDNSVEVQLFRPLLPLFAMLIATIATRVLWRMAGLSLAYRTESPLEMESEQIAPNSSELRSYAVQTGFRVLSWLYVGIAVLMVPVGFRAQVRSKALVPVWPLFLGALAVAGIFWLVSTLNRRGKFVARADEEGLEIQDFRQRNKLMHLKWSQIPTAVEVKNSNVMADQTHIEIRDAQGKTKAQISLDVSPRMQQQEFTQVVARYLSSSRST